MISHLGHLILTDMTDPTALPDVLSVNRSVFKELAIEKIRNHFGSGITEVMKRSSDNDVINIV